MAAKDPLYRPTAASFGPDGAMLAQLVENHYIPVRMQAVLAYGSSSSRRAPEVPRQAGRIPMDAEMQNALGDTKGFSERSRAGRP